VSEKIQREIEGEEKEREVQNYSTEVNE